MDVHTVELLLDSGLEYDVRNWWNLLADAGLPSLATHAHPTNRPHLTLLTAASLAGLPALSLPVEVELGPVRFLGRALVLDVRPTAELREMHCRVWAALVDGDPWPPPSEWRPHVSLALKVPESERDVALAVLANIPPSRGQFTAARTYDTRTRVVRGL